MKIFVLNSGSSSLKYQVIDMAKDETIAEGICERIGINDSEMTYKAHGKKINVLHDMPSHKEAIDLVLQTLQGENGVIKSIEEIDAVGHRVLHGAETFKDSVLIDEKVLSELEENIPLGPLHMPANIMGIKNCMELMPGKPNVAVFDTAFHQTIPDYAYTYPLPYQDYEELRVRKYGFHGTSHKYVSETVSKLLGTEKGKVIICHLGNGSSISAIKDGECIDTSMGLTPLEGLMMGTRCGDLDPAAVLYVMDKRGMSISEMDTYMNKKSGILGVFGKDSDFRNVRKACKEGDERAILTFNMLTYRIRQYIGSYAASLGGVDAICFTGGIGENSGEARSKICENLEFLGVELDEEYNAKVENERIGGDVQISKGKVKVFRINTNEELMIAEDTYRLIK